MLAGGRHCGRRQYRCGRQYRNRRRGAGRRPGELYSKRKCRSCRRVGVEDIVVVATEDATVVLPKAKAGRIKDIVAGLAAEERREVAEHRCIYRPWGYSQDVDLGERFKVKRLVVNPGGQLSLQKHSQRAEHWVVVKGIARVTCGGTTRDLSPDQSTYIPLGEIHRLENPGDEPLHVVEVQTGDYVGEDDIERFEDIYGRTKKK